MAVDRLPWRKWLMATIYKRKKGKKNEPYSIQYLDHEGKRRTTKGFTDKGLTEQLAAKLETEARLRQTGLIDPELEGFANHKMAPIEQHLTAFETSLADNSPKYVKQTMNEVRRIVTGTECKMLADLKPESVQAFVRSLRVTNKIGHRTYNHYLESADTFCNWCVETKRLLTNPLATIERLNTAVDVRHPRRALTPDEVGKLVRSARESGIQIQRFTGEQRARIYILSYMTGLRRNELASLTPRSFALESEPPTLTVEAESSKHRRKDVLPLHPELVSMLRDWLRGMQPNEKLFPMLSRRKTWRMVKRDLERVGIPYQTEEGIADFHAAGRHTHITELLRNGASLPEAKELARHSDIKTTMRYAHIGLKDRARAVAALPAHALHGRCISGVSGRHSKAMNGKSQKDPKQKNPCRDKGFGTDCHRLSKDDKVGATGDGHFLTILPGYGCSMRQSLWHSRLPPRNSKLSATRWCPDQGIAASRCPPHQFSRNRSWRIPPCIASQTKSSYHEMATLL
jgi:site-specific recombinase XerD